MILITKREVSAWLCWLQRYERQRKMQKMGNLGIVGDKSRSLEKWKHSIERVRVLTIAFHSNYVPILHRLREMARYWSKIADFNL